MGFTTKFGIEDKLDDNVDSAFSVDGQKVGKAIERHHTLMELQIDMVGGQESIDDEIFQNQSAYLVFNWDMAHIRERALELGLKAQYSPAYTLLRTALEGEMKGVFFNSLKDSQFREHVRPEKSKYQDTIRELFDEIEDKNIETTLSIFDIINNTDTDLIHSIESARIRETLADAGRFNPFKRREIDDWFRDLSKSVHVHLYETSSYRAIESGGELFESPQHSQPHFDDFLKTHGELLDILGVLAVNEFAPHIKNNDDVQSQIEEKEYNLVELELTKIYSRLEDLCDYNEPL